MARGETSLSKSLSNSRRVWLVNFDPTIGLKSARLVRQCDEFDQLANCHQTRGPADGMEGCIRAESVLVRVRPDALNFPSKLRPQMCFNWRGVDLARFCGNAWAICPGLLDQVAAAVGSIVEGPVSVVRCR